MRTVIFTIITISLLTIITPSVMAQELRTFTIVPPSVEKTLNPGSIAEGTMKIVNDSDETVTFTADVRDFIVEDAAGSPKILPSNTLSNKYSAASWVGVTPSTFTVKPHEKQTLNYYIQIPANASPGGHYGVVLYTPASDQAERTGASVKTQMGTLFYLTVNGQISEFSKISQFFANAFQEYGPVDIKTRIQNLGDLHIKPEGAIKVQDMLGQSVGNNSMAEFNIFPGAARSYTNTFGQKFMLGRYQATLTATYGKSNKMPLMSTIYFWVFPWKLSLVAVLAIVAVVLGVMYFKKRDNNTPIDANKKAN